MYRVEIVENGLQAQELISGFEMEGYTKENIYLFAHDTKRSEHLTEATNTEDIGIKEQGIFETMGNYFRSRGDELRSKMRSVGLSQAEAEKFEEELDKGKLVIVASKETSDIAGTRNY
ncbi:general stress protein [Bacillus sp. 2205SS5-2]|uniref:general stress protein n=1 Tax=Bacillus sp. 2205SS5-2 TaxID=3109031 RepID=UPI0030046A4F